MLKKKAAFKDAVSLKQRKSLHFNNKCLYFLKIYYTLW